MTILSQCQQGETLVQVPLKDLPVIFITLDLAVLEWVVPPLGVKWKVNPDQDGAKDCYIEWQVRNNKDTAMVPTTPLVLILVPMGLVVLQLSHREVIAHFSTKGNTHVVLLMGVWSQPPGPVTILAWTMPRTLRLCNHRFCQFEAA